MAPADSETVTFPGSMKAGMYTAQIGVSLVVSRETVTVKSFWRTVSIDRQNLVGLADTSLLGIFKRGIRFLHRQPGVPGRVVFYPYFSREQVRQKLAELGWS